VWDRDLFDQAVMIVWNEQLSVQKDYTHVVAYFTKNRVAIESFEAAGGGASKKQGYKSTDVAAEFQAVCIAEIRENRATTNKKNKVMTMAFTGAIMEQQATIKSLCKILASIASRPRSKDATTPAAPGGSENSIAKITEAL
jgi:hypothetical protein